MVIIFSNWDTFESEGGALNNPGARGKEDCPRLLRTNVRSSCNSIEVVSRRHLTVRRINKEGDALCHKVNEVMD